MTSRFASHHLFLPSGEVLLQQVVEIERGCVLRYFPLNEETPSVSWLGEGVIVLSPNPACILSGYTTLTDLLCFMHDGMQNKYCYAYYLEGADKETDLISDDAYLQRLK